MRRELGTGKIFQGLHEEKLPRRSELEKQRERASSEAEEALSFIGHAP